MVMQGTKIVSQALSGFDVGNNYEVSWAEARRPWGNSNDIRVFIDSTIVDALHVVSDTSWNVETSATFTATSTTHTLKFETLNSAGGPPNTAK